MIIELSQIYSDKPYYTIRNKDGTIAYALGYKQIEAFVKKARDVGEEIKIEETKFLEEHSRLVALLNT